MARSMDELRRASSQTTRRTTRRRRRQQTLTDLVRIAETRQQVQREVRKTRQGRGVRVDRGDVLRRATPAARRSVQTTRRVKPKGARRGVTVDVGDILGGRTPPPPKRHRPTFGEALRDELEGKGAIAEAFQRGSKALGPLLVPSGDITIRRGGKTIRSQATVAGIPGAPKLGERGQRFVKDLLNFPAVAVPSLYVPAAAAVEAAQGDKKRGRQLLRDIKETDPWYAAGEAGVKLVQGDTKGAGKAIARAGKLADEHPGFTFLETLGVAGVAGRATGATMRSGVLGATAKGAASTVRPSAVVPGTPLAQRRAYSRDIFRKAVQVQSERRKVNLAARLRARAREADADEAVELRQRANKIDPLIMSGSAIRKRIDMRVGAEERLRRQHRSLTAREARAAIKVGGKPSAATTLHAQAITKADPSDLGSYLLELADNYDTLGPSGKRANAQLRRQITKALEDKPDPKALTRAAEAYADVMRPRTAKLVEQGILSVTEGQKAPLIPYAVRHMGAHHDGSQIVDRNGDPLTTKQIRQHMREHGVKEPAFVTQAPNQRGARNYFISSGRPPSIGTSRRTGEATRRGTFDADPEVLVESAVRAQGLVDAAEGFNRTIKEFAHRPTLGKLKTKQDADRAARDLEAETGEQFRPVRIQPFGGRREQLQAVLDQAREGTLDETVAGRQPVREALESAARGEDGPGPWALLPDAAADQLAQHMRSLGGGAKAKTAQLVSSTFRRTVLATSPSWITGNALEASLRTALAKAGPTSYILAKRVMNELSRIDPAAMQEVSNRVLGGGHFAMADRHIRRDSSQFQGSALEPLARALGTFWRAPGPKQVAHVWQRYTELVFRQLNGQLESQFQTAMLGRALRQSPLMDGHTLKLSRTAVEQAARGLRDTNDQAEFARQIERMYGKYDGFSADTRWMIATYTPFVAWIINAAYFVSRTLPSDHPMATAVIAATEQWTEEWRKTHGLDLFIQDALPGWLQGSIPLSGGRHQRTPTRYTPFGAFGDPLQTVGNAVLPQLSGVLAAFDGEDWKNTKLRNKDGTPIDTLGKARAAAMAFAESTVPLLSVVKRVSNKGTTALNPFQPITPPADKAPSKGGVKLREVLLRGGQGTTKPLRSVDLTKTRP